MRSAGSRSRPGGALRAPNPPTATAGLASQRGRGLGGEHRPHGWNLSMTLSGPQPWWGDGKNTPNTQERGGTGREDGAGEPAPVDPGNEPEVSQHPPAHPADPHSLEGVFRVIHGERTRLAAAPPVPRGRSRYRFESPAQPQSP